MYVHENVVVIRAIIRLSFLLVKGSDVKRRQCTLPLTMVVFMIWYAQFYVVIGLCVADSDDAMCFFI